MSIENIPLHLGTPYKEQPFTEIRMEPFLWNQFEKSNNKYYCFSFNDGGFLSAFPLTSLLSMEQIEHIRSGGAFLVFANRHESFHYYVADMYQTLAIKQGIPPQQVILMSESADIHDHVRSVANFLNLPPFNSIWITGMEYDILCNLKSMSSVPKGIISKSSYNKKYLCLNRRWRSHRTVLVELLTAKNLISKGHVSLGKSDDYRSWKNVIDEDINLMSNNTDAVNLIQSVRDTLINNFVDLYLDTTDLVTNRAILTTDTNYLYEETYFSVVTETNYFKAGRPIDATRFFSEKIFKPIAMRHPFIVVTVPHFFDKLRYLGYKSFSPYIDESYDQEDDDADRMMMIVNEINRLSSLDNTELMSWLQAVNDICEYNYFNLMSKKPRDFFHPYL